MELGKKEFDPISKRGNSHKHSKRVINVILYVVRGGIQWRLMPNDSPPWQTVYGHFSRWNKRGDIIRPGYISSRGLNASYH
jgi:putative transposase